MSPTIKDSDIVIIKNFKKNSKVVRGDIIAFYRFIEAKKLFIKRVIGLPNETIILKQDGKTLVNNIYLDEPYVFLHNDVNQNWNLIDDTYVVLGDNRNNSEDSRKYGPLIHKEFIGKVIFSLKPLKKIK